MSKKDKPRSKDTNLLSNEPDIGSRLRQIRKNLSLSLQVVAERADVSVGTLSQLERGLSQPSLRTLQNVCTALGIPFAWLFQTSDAELGEGDQVVAQGVWAPADTAPAKRLTLRADALHVVAMGRDLAKQLMS